MYGGVCKRGVTTFLYHRHCFRASVSAKKMREMRGKKTEASLSGTTSLLLQSTSTRPDQDQGLPSVKPGGNAVALLLFFIEQCCSDVFKLIKRIGGCFLG